MGRKLCLTGTSSTSPTTLTAASGTSSENSDARSLNISCYNYRMGSGKGKTRRVQATTSGTAVEEVVLVEKKWASFLEDNHIGRIKVYKYYFDNIPQQPVASDYEGAITELFADAVSVGAITLPSPYNVESFQFKIEIGRASC